MKETENSNAPKRGFYARRYSAGEREDLAARLSEGVSDEITMLRVIVRRMFNATLDSEVGDQGEPDLVMLAHDDPFNVLQELFRGLMNELYIFSAEFSAFFYLFPIFLVSL